MPPPGGRHGRGHRGLRRWRVGERGAFSAGAQPRASRRRTWLALGLWAIAILAVAIAGRGIESRLSPMTLTVPGSPSAKAEATLEQRFGHTVPIALLLRGPAAALDRQGPRVVGALRRLPAVQVMSPFASGDAGMARGMARTLRPSPGAALVLMTFIRPPSAAMATVPATERVLARTVRAPVHPYLTGVAVIGKALQDSTLAATERAELIALPVLVLVLLLVFRSPLAAALPLVMGGATVTAGHGLLWVASFFTPINSLGVAVAAMMSLALGVDYALLMVSRVRQEVARGAEREAAITVATRTAGRTIVAAGGTLVLTMLAASEVATPGLLGPVATGVVISGLLSVALALSALPAMLRLAGARLDRWELHLGRLASAAPSGRLRRAAERLIARPALTAPLILAGMLALAVPAGALQMGPPDPSELPAASPARVAMRALERTIGPGWAAPFVVVASAREGTMTTSKRLDALIRWEDRVAHDRDVAAVLGPASVAGAQRKLAEAHAALAAAPKRLAGAHRGITKLQAGLARAHDGVSALRSGLAAALAGARSLGGGAASARGGALLLAGESARASAGARRLAGASASAHAGAERLAAGSRRARGGAERLTRETSRAQAGAARLTSETARAGAGAGTLQEGLAQAAAGSSRLADGLGEAAAGAKRLAASDSRLAGGAAEEAAGMHTLDATVHAATAPVEALAESLHELSSLVGRLEGSEAHLASELREAMAAMEAMTVGRNDPRYAALSQALDNMAQALEQSGLAHLVSAGGPLARELEQLEALPAALSRMTAGIDHLTAGADQVAAGAQESEAGARQLSAGLDRLDTGGRALSGGVSGLSASASTLTGGIEALSAGGGQLTSGLGALARADRQLAGGISHLSSGSGRLAHGAGRLAVGDRRLAGGLDRLSAGGGRLAGGLGKLAGGAEHLARGLASGTDRTGRLAEGLAGANRPLARYASALARYERSYRLLHARSPRALDSGYLVLTALDGTVGPLREQVEQLVNVSAGGQAARMMIVPASAPSSAATARLSAELQRSLPGLAAATGGTVEIGQGAQYLLDYRNANSARFPWLVLALAVVAALTLIVVLRALLLPVIAVALNLATIAVALGALELLTAAHVLGGPGYIDAASGAGIVSIMFVLSIDYEVFLLTRMRERWIEGAEPAEAIAHGLRHTASVITGSAAIMAAVFCAFAGAPVVPLRQFGTGLTIAVLLDATLVRLVLLPAVMRIGGARLWWLPARLERSLPHLEGGHGGSRATGPEASAA